MLFPTVALSLLPVLAAAAPAKRAGMTHVVQVAPSGLRYSPTSITAAVGDVISFEWLGAGHSVTQSSFAAPCAYSVTGLDSSIITAVPSSWQVTVETADPLWFSCRVPGHCSSGMVFAVNPTATDTFAAFMANAMSAAAGTYTPAATVEVLSGSGVVAAASVTAGNPPSAGAATSSAAAAATSMTMSMPATSAKSAAASSSPAAAAATTKAAGASTQRAAAGLLLGALLFSVAL
ncbi:hypothetical protein RQP46_001718 [Phenoliferia psychrophenolica]